MPTYSYKCSKCGDIFDIEATIQEKEVGGEKFICPKCGTKEVKQQFSVFSIIKGSFSGSDDGCCSGGNFCDM